MGIWNKLFGASAEKFEDKADELRLDLMYKDAAFYYTKALDALAETAGPDCDRLRTKRREVRRKAFAELIEESMELTRDQDFGLARERLEMATAFADDPLTEAEVERRLEELHALQNTSDPRLDSEADAPEEVRGTDEDLFELALAGLDPEDQERALGMGEVFRVAYESCQNEDWKEAREQFETLLTDHGDDPLLREMMALACEELGDVEEACEQYRKAYAVDPVRPASVQGLVEILRKLDRSEEAAEVLTESVARVPVREDLPDTWVTIHLEHGRRLAETGEFDGAIEAFRGLMPARAANRGSLYFNMAGVLEQAGREEECRSALEAAIEVAPRNSLFRERLADFLMKRGKELDAALKLLYEANEVETTGPAGMLGGGGGGKIKISPHRGRYLYKMARIYYLKGEDAEADRTISIALAVAKDPDLIEALEGLRGDLQEGAEAE